MVKRLLWFGFGTLMAMLLIFAGIIGGKMSKDGSDVKLAILEVFANQVDSALEPSTMVLEDNLYMCGDIEEVSRKPLSSYNISTKKQVKDRFSNPGLSLIINQNEILVQKKINDFCSYHRGFRHFGIHENKLAIYQGPLGYSQRLIKVEESIPLENLSAAFQVKLRQAMDFSQMNPETQSKLRDELEFFNDDKLNAVLENLDEMQD